MCWEDDHTPAQTPRTKRIERAWLMLLMKALERLNGGRHGTANEMQRRVDRSD